MCNLDKYYTKENTSGLWPRQGPQYLAFAVKSKAEVNQGITEKKGRENGVRKGLLHEETW